jgi:hypothetical protein
MASTPKKTMNIDDGITDDMLLRARRVGRFTIQLESRGDSLTYEACYVS